MERNMMSYFEEKPDKVRPNFFEALASAVHEWILIFLLFIEASFSYLVTKFARKCHLETPCLLCSRLDHVLGKERSDFYLDLICHKHKLQMSSLVLCHYHSNLVDVHEMCENCLFSFAVVNKSNAETYRLLVGKMGDGRQIGLDGNSKSCACCNEQSVSRAYAPETSETKSTEFQGSELKLHSPLFDTGGVREHKIPKDVTYRAGKVNPSSMSNFSPMPYIEYEKVKLTSDSDSETPMSIHKSSNFLLKEYRKRYFMGPEVGTPTGDPVREKFIYPARESEPSHMDLEVKRDVTNTKHTEEAIAILDHGSEGMKSFVEHKNDDFDSPDSISFAVSPRDIEDIVDLYKETLEAREEAEAKEEAEAREEAEVETEERKDSAGDCKIDNQSILLSTNEEQSPSEHDIGGRSLQMPNSLELGDAYNLAVNSRIRQLSSKVFEKRSLSGKRLQQSSLSFKESPRGREDFQLLLSQLSLARGIDQPLTDMSPRFSETFRDLTPSAASTSAAGTFHELTPSDASTSAAETQVHQRKISLERNESNILLDGSSVNEIEGESAIDRLKRQVDHDKKLMYALYKELEEERNASAVAANQAMAMITRLQEEKAALNMEALQCLRMMDEQVDFDEETARNLITEKDEVVQDLELELELYRQRYGPLSMEEDMAEELFISSHLEEIRADDINACHEESSTGISPKSESNQNDTFDSQSIGSGDRNQPS